MGNSIMIYLVSGTYFDEATNPNAKTEAEAFLKQKRQDTLHQESYRFSICATFVNGNDTTWREVQETDPENTICQVFDHLKGSYTQVSTKTEANVLNEQRKQDYLASLKLDAVQELTEMPTILATPGLADAFGPVNGAIPVEQI